MNLLDMTNRRGDNKTGVTAHMALCVLLWNVFSRILFAQEEDDDVRLVWRRKISPHRKNGKKSSNIYQKRNINNNSAFAPCSYRVNGKISKKKASRQKKHLAARQ